MKHSEASLGRIFVLRLEHDDSIPGIIEDFAKEKEINAALVYFLGGVQKDSKVVVGPQKEFHAKPVPMIQMLSGVTEAVGWGTIFTNEKGCPKLHLHASFGREQATITGCTREGVQIWHIGEVVVLELLTISAVRKVNPDNGFELLELETP
ncbi:MAG: PPC domain-containing DNA-binding protein [Bacillota bacterium]